MRLSTTSSPSRAAADAPPRCGTCFELLPQQRPASAATVWYIIQMMNPIATIATTQ